MGFEMKKNGGLARRQVLALGAATAAGLHLPAGMAQTAAAGRKPSGQVVAGISQEPTVFHPLMPGSEVDQGVWWAVFSPLWYLDAEGRAIPDLAREVPSTENGGLSADGLAWKVKLRSDARWHDGTTFTADDVKFTLELINNPGFRARNRAGHSLGKDIVVVAPDEIHWKMDKPYAPYLSIMALVFMVPKHLLEKAGLNDAPFNQAPVGTGPFKWVKRVAGDHIQLEAHAGYHKAGPYLQRFFFKYIPDLTVLYTQFRTGDIDYIGQPGVSANFVEKARGLQGRTLYPAPTPIIDYIALNLEHPPFASKVVRQALYLGMNKRARIDAIYYGLPQPTESFFPPQSWAAKTDLPKHVHDPAQANALLDGAGWVRGSDGIRSKGGVRLEFTNSTTSGNPQREQAQQLLAQEWREIGAAMTIKNMPGAVMWGDFWQKSQFQSAMVGSNFLLGSDPDVTPRFSSKAIPAKGGNGLNTLQYQNPEIDRLMQLGASQFSLEARKKTYGQIQSIVREDLPLLPISQFITVEGMKSGLRGFQANINCSSNCWNVREWHWA